MRSDTEIKQTVIAILTCARDGDASSAAGLSPVLSPGEQGGRQMVTAAVYAMSLFHTLAAEFEASCPDVDVEAFLRRQALELVAEGGEAA